MQPSTPSPSHYRRLCLVTVVLLPLVAFGCSRRIDDEESPVRFERRTDACTGWCEVKMDAECGGSTAFPDLDACIDQCTSEESVNWGLRPDGTDACFDEQVAFFGCFDDLPCEDRRRWFADSSENHSHPCRPIFDTVVTCLNKLQSD